jgi:hypothetical protein
MQLACSRTVTTLHHRLVTVALSALLGWSLLAAITLPAGPEPAANTDQRELSLAGSPFGEWLAGELRNRAGLRTTSWPAAGSADQEEEGADGLTFLRLHSAGQSASSASWPGPASPVRRANTRTSPTSPRAPPASA